MQSAVIQALPSDQQTLPNLQSTKKRCPPNSPIKQRKSAPKPTSSPRRILPCLPKIEDLTLPKIQLRAVKRVASSSKKLPVFQVVEKQNLVSAQIPETKTCATIKRVRRVLPSIPPTETRTPRTPRTKTPRDPPSIQSTAVKPTARCKGAHRKPTLPSLQTIKEQTFLELSKNETSTTLQGGGKEDTSSTLRQGVKLGPTRRKEESCCFQPGKKELRSKTRNTGKGTKTIVQSIDKETRPGLRPIDSNKRYLHSSDVTGQVKQRGTIFPRVKKTSDCSENEEGEVLSKREKCQKETENSDTMEGAPAATDKVKGYYLREGELLPCVKQSKKSSHSEAKEVSQTAARLNNDTTLRTQEKLAISTEKKEKICQKMMGEGATLKHINTSRESSEKKDVPFLRKRDDFPNSEHRLDQKPLWPPLTRRQKEEEQWSEQGAQRTREHRENEDLLSLHSKLNRCRRKPSWIDGCELRGDKQREPISKLQNCQHRENVGKSNTNSESILNRTLTDLPSADSNSLLNPKRKQFELLQPLRLNARRSQTDTLFSVKLRNNPVLTVKPAFLGSQDIHGSKVPNPPTVPKLKKGLPSAQQNVKRAHTRIKAVLRRPLLNIQPIIKQATPSLDSSSLQGLVKKPLPSVQPESELHAAPAAVEETQAKYGLPINREEIKR